jgi:hypothetical protein
MASIVSVDVITGVTDSNYTQLPKDVADGTTITFTTQANRLVMSLAPKGIELSHFSDAVLQQVTANSSVALPGTIIQKDGVNIPPGTLICNGQAVSRAEYAGLFGEIGTSFGGGDGVSTFNVPNYGGNHFIKF